MSDEEKEETYFSQFLNSLTGNGEEKEEKDSTSGKKEERPPPKQVNKEEEEVNEDEKLDLGLPRLPSLESVGKNEVVEGEGDGEEENEVPKARRKQKKPREEQVVKSKRKPKKLIVRDEVPEVEELEDTTLEARREIFHRTGGDGGEGDGNEPTLENEEVVNITFDSAEIESSTDEAKKLVLVFQIMLNAATQLSLINTDQELGAFTDTFGWLSVVTLGFNFSDDDANFAISVAVVTFPPLLFLIFCYIKQRPGYDIKKMSHSLKERCWLYGSLAATAGLSLLSLCLTLGFITYNEDEPSQTQETVIITFSVVAFIFMITFAALWLARLIIYSDRLTGDSKVTYRTLEVWTVQLFFGQLLVPLLSLSLRAFLNSPREIERDPEQAIFFLGFAEFCFVVVILCLFLNSGRKSNTALPDFPIRCCCFEMSTRQDIITVLNEFMFLKHIFRSDESPNVRRQPPYPWPFTQKTVEAETWCCLVHDDKCKPFECSRWWYPAVFYLEQATIAIFREVYFFQEEDALSFAIGLSSTFAAAFVANFIFRPYNAERRQFLWLADLFSRFYIFGISILTLFAVATNDEEMAGNETMINLTMSANETMFNHTMEEDEESTADLLLTIATYLGAAFVLIFLFSGGIIRLLLNTCTAWSVSNQVNKDEENQEVFSDNSLEQVDDLFFTPAQRTPENAEFNQKPLLQYATWQLLTQNQRLYLLAKIKPSAEFLVDFENRGCYCCENRQNICNGWKCNAGPFGFYLNTDENFSFFSWRFVKTILGQYTLSKFDKSFIDFKSVGYNKTQYLLRRGLEATVVGQKLKRLEFNGAVFTTGTWAAVATLGNENHNIQLTFETIMFTDCTFDEDSWSEFRELFLTTPAVRENLKSLAFLSCDIYHASLLQDQIGGLTALETLFLENITGEQQDDHGLHEIVEKMLPVQNDTLEYLAINQNEEASNLKNISFAGSAFDSTLMCRAIYAKLRSDKFRNKQMKIKLGEIDFNYYGVLILLEMKEVTDKKITVFEATVKRPDNIEELNERIHTDDGEAPPLLTDEDQIERRMAEVNKGRTIIWNSLKALVLRAKLADDIRVANENKARQGPGAVARAYQSMRNINNRSRRNINDENRRECCCKIFSCFDCLGHLICSVFAPERYDMCRVTCCGWFLIQENGERYNRSNRFCNKVNYCWDGVGRFLSCKTSTADASNIIRFHFDQADFDEERAIMADYYATKDYKDCCSCGKRIFTEKGRIAREDDSLTHPFFVLADERQRFEFLKENLNERQFADAAKFLPAFWHPNGNIEPATYEAYRSREDLIADIADFKNNRFIKDDFEEENHV